MDYNQFAESIKAKYPQYKDVDNLTLSQKMVEKYPVYASKVTFEEPKKKQTFGESLKDIETNPATKFIMNNFAGKKVGESIGTLAGYALSKNKDFYDTSAPTPLQVGGDILSGAAQVAGLKMPIAGKPIGRIAQSAGLGATLAGSKSISEGNSITEVAKDTALGGAKGTITQGLFEAVPPIANFVQKIAGKQANSLREKNLRLTPVQKQNLGKKVQEATDYLSRNKVTGSPTKQFETISKKYEEMESQVQSAINNTGKNYTKKELIDEINLIPEKYATEFDNPEVYDQLVKKSETFSNYIQKNFKDSIPAKKLNAFKRAYYKNAFNKAGDSVNNEANLAIADSIYSKLTTDVPELKPLNDEYSTVILTKKLLGKALGRNELGLIGSLVASGAGGAIGASLGGPIGAGAGAVAGPAVAKIVAGTAAKTNYARALEKLRDIASKNNTAANITIPRSIINILLSRRD